MIPDQKCKKCGHRQQRLNSNSDICLLDNSPVDADNYCPHYTESPYICELCGNHLISENVIWVSGANVSYHLICKHCASLLDKCHTCKQAQNCKFQTDNTIAEPAYVMQTIQQGPMITQTQVKNPKRIELTCKTGCPCYINSECAKEAEMCCSKYECAVENW